MDTSQANPNSFSLVLYFTFQIQFFAAITFKTTFLFKGKAFVVSDSQGKFLFLFLLLLFPSFSVLISWGRVYMGRQKKNLNSLIHVRMYCTLLPSFVFFVGDRCAFASTWRVSLLFLSPSLNLVMLNVGKGRKRVPSISCAVAAGVVIRFRQIYLGLSVPSWFFILI